jgi:hypothetical protein
MRNSGSSIIPVVAADKETFAYQFDFAELSHPGKPRNVAAGF